jgi:DnaJ-domain-containing protein 1
MPRIFLKPNSADYDDGSKASKTRMCDMPGCAHTAEHRAPKDRSLNEYYHFCMDHVREYNKAWNFFEGMSAHEVEDHLHKSLYGDRPTWKYGVNGDAYEALYTKAWQTFHNSEKEPPKQKQQYNSYSSAPALTPEHEALAVMGLAPPVTLEEIKTRYKSLAKKHHPDLNHGDKESQELLKQINMAYTILKLAYEKFEELPRRE